jgi:hypothetical protein
MTQTAENHFNNKSGPKGYTAGNRGKFSEGQTEERITVHAKAISTGSPTLSEIVDFWKTEHGIDITYQSEKEWRKSNRNIIEKKRQELIESGEIEVPVVGKKVLADSLMTLVIENGSTISLLRKKVKKLVETIPLDGNDPKLKEKLSIFKAYSEAMADFGNNITKQFAQMSELSGLLQLDMKGKELDDNNLEKKLLELKKRDEEEDFDPTAPITDEDRGKA